jgi:hypothetical protein
MTSRRLASWPATDVAALDMPALQRNARGGIVDDGGLRR